MKIPKKVKVGAYTYKVKFSTDIGTEGNCYGSTHHSTEQIFIDPKYSIDKKNVTFIHELLHIVFEVAGLNHRWDKKDREALPTDEDVARETATLLYQVIKENKEIFK